MDTLHRQWSMLKRIPRLPNRVTVGELSDYLTDEGYDIERRSIQRDLDKLSTLFPLASETEGRTNYWFWTKDAATIEIPGMNPSAALVMRLSEDYLTPILPRSVLSHLSDYYQRADQVLLGTAMGKWTKKVKIIQRGPLLQQPKIHNETLAVVYSALLNDLCFEATYNSRTSQQKNSYQINPLGLVIKNHIIYLVCTLWDYVDIRQLVVHRMTDAHLIDKKVNRPKHFNLDTYIQDEQSFSYPLDSKPKQIELLFDTDAAYHLHETPLSSDQSIITQNGKSLLKATVMITDELRWWIFGFGEYVEVIKPKSLRQDIAESIERAARNYHDAT